MADAQIVAEAAEALEALSSAGGRAPTPFVRLADGRILIDHAEIRRAYHLAAPLREALAEGNVWTAAEYVLGPVDAPDGQSCWMVHALDGTVASLIEFKSFEAARAAIPDSLQPQTLGEVFEAGLWAYVRDDLGRLLHFSVPSFKFVDEVEDFELSGAIHALAVLLKSRQDATQYAIDDVGYEELDDTHLLVRGTVALGLPGHLTKKSWVVIVRIEEGRLAEARRFSTTADARQWYRAREQGGG